MSQHNYLSDQTDMSKPKKVHHKSGRKAKTILFHSFRPGVGRSSISANIAYLLASQGRRIGLIDTDTKSPILHNLFGLDETLFGYSFNDYLARACTLEEATYDITPHLDDKIKGQISLIPASPGSVKTGRELDDTSDVDQFNTDCRKLIDTLELDALLIDIQPGLSEKALVSITISDTLVIVLHLDQRDYQGTSVTMDIVRKLKIPRVMLIINEAPKNFDYNDVKAKVENTYHCEVAAILPHVDEIMALGNQDVFVRHYPNHPVSDTLRAAAAKLME